MRAILFNEENIIVQESSYQKFREKINIELTPYRGTEFPVPLRYILDMIKEGNTKQLHVLFLTDGKDDSKDETKLVSEELKKELTKREIYSKFSVIGLGEHEA